MFKTHFFTLLSLLLASIGSAYGQTEYTTQTDIAYYSPAKIQDEYQQSQCKLDLYYPTNSKNFKTVVWFHSGGLRGGYKAIPDELKQQGIAVVAVGYRLHPKVKNPTYIEDAAAATAWVFNNIEKFAGSTKQIYLAGHSAGGYLTSMLGLDKTWLAKHKIDANQLAGLFAFSGHAVTHFTVREEQGIADTQLVVDEYAPLFHVRKDAPPLWLVTGDRELEMLGRYEENALLWRIMQVVGHTQTKIFELDGFHHGNMVHPAYSIMLEHLKR